MLCTSFSISSASSAFPALRNYHLGISPLHFWWPSENDWNPNPAMLYTGSKALIRELCPIRSNMVYVSVITKSYHQIIADGILEILTDFPYITRFSSFDGTLLQMLFIEWQVCLYFYSEIFAFIRAIKSRLVSRIEFLRNKNIFWKLKEKLAKIYTLNINFAKIFVIMPISSAKMRNSKNCIFEKKSN